MSDAGWPKAVAGCDFVLHVASPFGRAKTRGRSHHPGTRRGAARAARDAGVKRVVMTSSFAAIGYGQKITDRPFSEENWTDPNGGNMSSYVKSKTLAERAAWDFIAREGGALELSVVNPVGVLGPVLGPDYPTSIQLVQRLMDGAIRGCPRLSFGIVDVRDVADLHLRAMINPAAKGERFLAAAGESIAMMEIASVLRARMGKAAERVPTRVLPDFMVRLAALFDPAIAQIVPELGKFKKVTNAKARRALDWTPRSNEEAIVATAQSLVRLGALRTSRNAV